MSQIKQAVRVTIGGEEFTIRSEHEPEYTRQVAAYLDQALTKVRQMVPAVESHKAAILAALSITDELFQARLGDDDHAKRLDAIADSLSRIVPPNKRSSRTRGGEPTP